MEIIPFLLKSDLAHHWTIGTYTSCNSKRKLKNRTVYIYTYFETGHLAPLLLLSHFFLSPALFSLLISSPLFPINVHDLYFVREKWDRFKFSFGVHVFVFFLLTPFCSAGLDTNKPFEFVGECSLVCPSDDTFTKYSHNVNVYVFAHFFFGDLRAWTRS